MQIEIREPGSEAFYRETTNVLCQYRALRAKPDGKLHDKFREMRNILILCAAALAILVALVVTDGWTTWRIVAAVLLAVDGVFYAYYLRGLHKTFKTLMDDHRTSVLTLDDAGVELNKENAQVVRASWENIAFARVFKESVCFFVKDGTGFVLSVSRQYEGELLPYLRGRDDLALLEIT